MPRCRCCRKWRPVVEEPPKPPERRCSLMQNTRCNSMQFQYAHPYTNVHPPHPVHHVPHATIGTQRHKHVQNTSPTFYSQFVDLPGESSNERNSSTSTLATVQVRTAHEQRTPASTQKRSHRDVQEADVGIEKVSECILKRHECEQSDLSVQKDMTLQKDSSTRKPTHARQSRTRTDKVNMVSAIKGRRSRGTSSRSRSHVNKSRHEHSITEEAVHTKISNVKYWEDKVSEHMKQKERSVGLYGLSNVDRIIALKAKVNQHFEAHLRQFKTVEWPVVPISLK
ncbi:hypothetical protein SARC_01566 [Sphaeroforma arctica JP610]|uniref:Uncharacterized protein n=1 Tax=Sphaeroforma arctica JP610 TaxID=667725 RepID=A0A0L0GBD0_9EUKA|nr:hypothetical protein SARC_01566 [Sphaeroforma arctica JP610]KNC86305.1 hypothetical protein SARC_01566 [Sphaeroforma arctica JP610]|eukprot:XP_014160207.1 hypothetical protein SARC_01566 [Sphaeroforma arctica JP610]